MATNDEDLIRKVQALIAKAESTNSDEEYETFMAGAQRLITKHQIDAARLNPTERTDELTNLKVTITEPYGNAKARILTGIAKVNSVSVVQYRNPYLDRAKDFRLFGFESDIEIVQIMFASLQLQAVGGMDAALKRAKAAHKVSGSWRKWDAGATKSFKQGYLIGFATSIFERLNGDVQAAYEGADLLPVLFDKNKQVTSYMTALTGKLTKSSVSSGSHAGRRSGAADGRRADIGSARIATTRGALNA